MTTETAESALDYEEPIDRVSFNFELTRRQFVQVLGAGLLIASFDAPVDGAQGRGGGGRSVAARLHIARDGTITVLTGKVEGGQGARAQITQAAAEELRVAPSRINLIMADTSLVPDDGITAGSRTTPATLPAVRQGAAAARMLLVDLAARSWSVEPSQIELRDGMAFHAPTGRRQSYADLASSDQGTQAFAAAAPTSVSVTPVSQWKVMGVSFPRPNRRDLVTGAHKYPSDIVRPGMLYGRVLRPPSYGARLVDVDLTPARAVEGVVAVRDGSFVGVAAPNTFLAQKALEAVAKTARWEPAPHPNSSQVYDYLRSRANVPGNPFAAELSAAATSLRQTYHVAYVQHAPMETRAAVAEWADGLLTVWTASQNPFGVRGELMQAFRLGADRVRVIIPVCRGSRMCPNWTSNC
jgi:isoquinoline 1-oxidoreductase beta subunit